MVVANPTEDDVVACAGEHHVVARSCVDGVVAGPRNDVIVAGSSDDDVVAAASVDVVVACTSVDGVGAMRSEKIVVAGGPDDRRRLDYAEVSRLLNRCQAVADRIGQRDVAEHPCPARTSTAVLPVCVSVPEVDERPMILNRSPSGSVVPANNVRMKSSMLAPADPANAPGHWCAALGCEQYPRACCAVRRAVACHGHQHYHLRCRCRCRCRHHHAAAASTGIVARAGDVVAALNASPIGRSRHEAQWRRFRGRNHSSRSPLSQTEPDRHHIIRGFGFASRCRGHFFFSYRISSSTRGSL